MAAVREGRQARQLLSVLLLCVLWYVVSSSNNVIGKMVLSEFPYPLTVTVVQLMSITVYSGPLFNLWGVSRFADMSWSYHLRMIVPLSVGKFMASAFSHVSIWKVPVSYAHTVKATMPLFTVLLSRLILREKQTWKVYLSLVPIIAGVAIATVTEMSFDAVGLASALVATLGFSLQNIFSKKVLHDTGIHHLRLLHILGRLALLLFLPVWIIVDLRHLLREPVLPPGRGPHLLALLLTDGALNWLQNIAAFSVLSAVSPLTYAVASASKRVFVIGVSVLVLGNPVSASNMMGMAVAVGGVLCYNRAKYEARLQREHQVVLPLSHQRKTGLGRVNGVSNGHLGVNGKLVCV